MYLKNIYASGFKSFAEKTNISLDRNITCVVGPNGSGKSNIVDAIRWVLGEQSAKNIRGSSMADVIFAGSKSRNEANRVEVALTFDNQDNYLKCDFKEVEIKRVLYRSGESEYFINGAKVRLKDITDLFLDTGAGTDSFNIISQGSIGSVVNSKPHERRVIFEEAACVLKYKKRKDETLRKLEKTKENIEKVTLIIEELQVNLEPLKEQSQNAKKYLDLKEELKNIEIATITEEITTIEEKYHTLQTEMEQVKKELMQEEGKGIEDASLLETLKLKNIRLEEKISEQNQKLLDVTREFVNLQNEKVMYTERQKFSGNSKEVENNIVVLKEEVLKLEEAITLLETQMKQVSTSLEKQEKELQDCNEESSLLKVKRNSVSLKLQEQIHKLFECNNQKEILENNILNDVKMPSAVKNVLNNVRLKGVYNTIGKLIDIPNTYVNAIDTALGASSHFIVVENEKVAKDCILFLKENKLGRATFFPLNIIKERNVPESSIQIAKKTKGFIGIASNLIQYEEKFQNIIENQLGNVFVVEDINSLNALGKSLEYKYRIVSLDGEIMHAGGSLTGGTYKTDHSSLKDKMALEKVMQEGKTLEEEIDALKKELNTYDKTLEEIQEKEQMYTKTILNLKESHNEKNMVLVNKKEKKEELQKELEGSLALQRNAVDEKLITLLEQLSIKEQEKVVVEQNLQELKENKNALNSEIEELEQKYREKNSVYNKLQNELKTKEVAIGKFDIQLDHLLVSLNESYNLTYEQAKLNYHLDMDPEIAKNKVSSLKSAILKLGEVNVFAIEEYERVSTRYDFLTHQKEDLLLASTNLRTIIEEMDSIMIERFTKTFHQINEEFQKVFKKLFKGGNGKLELTDPENILETGVEIIAEPPGKKLNSIGLLSGGEKTLTAIALLFAILNVKTVPFCVLDEVEAALDEANVDAFGKYLQEYKKNSQFILITHKKRTMEYADTLYGITMQESGVSKIVSVKLENA